MAPKRHWVCIFAFSLGASAVISLQSKRQGGSSTGPIWRNRHFLASETKFKTGFSTRPISIPVVFEPSGDKHDGMQFVAQAGRVTASLTREGIELNAGRRSGSARLRFLGPSKKPSGRISWRGARKLRGESNYFIGNDPKKWRLHVLHFEHVEADLFGAQIVVYGNEEGLEYDLRFPPGMDASAVHFSVAGAHSVRLDSLGSLVAHIDGADIRMRKPDVYEEFPRATVRGNAGLAQNLYEPRKRRSRASCAGRPRNRKPGTRIPRKPKGLRRNRPKKPRRAPVESRARRQVEGSYVLAADGTIELRVGKRDPRATLVIDPSISVVYTSFLGGAGSETAGKVAVDSLGKIYIGGTTTSPSTFSETATAQLGPGVPATASGSANEFFVAKIDPTQTGANSLVYLTFLGGSATQTGGLIAVDSKGDVAITGTTTSPDFPVTDGSTRTTGPNNTTVSEIDPTGSKLVFSTLFGGNGAQSEQGKGGIALDSSGNVFIASDTDSSNLPVTTGAYATAYQSATSDGFLAVFLPSSTPRLKYCSYLGLTGQVGVGGLAVDSTGNAYIAGFTDDPNADFPSKNRLQAAFGGGSFDAFLMKLSPGGAGTGDLVYATMLGGTGADQAFAVTVDSASPPNAYVTGTTSSTNFPVNGTVPPYQGTLPSNATSLTSDAFLSVIAQNATTGATSLAYSTYLGGSQSDAGSGLAVVAPYAVFVVGSAKSWDFPWHDNLQPFNGYGDAFVAKLDTTSAGSASLIFSTPLGGTSPPGVTASAQGTGVALDSSGTVWVVGQTTSADFPSAGSAGNGFQLICSSCQESPLAGDAFVVAIQEQAAQLPSLYFAGPGIPLNFGKQALGTTNIPPQFAAIKNGGEASLNISSMGITGPNSADFSLSGAGACAPTSISPGGMCGFEVNFTPSVVGAESAFVQVASNAPGSPQVLQVVGAGVGLAVLPAILNFGKQITGTTSAPQSATLTNTTSDPVFIDSIQETGPNATAFVPANGAGACVAQASGTLPGGTCQVSYTFAPASAGMFQAEVDIQYHVQGLPEQRQVISMAGTGLAPAPISSIQPATLNFGTISVGAAAQTQVVTLTNSGSAALNLTGITITGTNASEFGLVASGSAPCPAFSGSLAIGAACTLGVKFVPQTAGVKSASLSFADNAAGSPQTVGLAGTAQSPPNIQITPTSLTFANQSIETKSSPQLIKITNAGGSPLAISGISLSGGNASDFTETNNCPPTVAAGATCSVSVTFEPAAAGARSASVSIADDASSSAQTVTLTGTGTQPTISFSPTSVNFGNQAAGTTSSATAVTVTNSGTGALAISKLSFSGTNAGDFSETDNCTGNAAANGVGPGGTCTIQIKFTPACGNPPAARSASLTVADNAAGSPQDVMLTGTATGNFCLLVPAGSSTTATIVAGQTAAYSLQAEAANGFTGNVNLACAGAPASATCGVNPASVNVGGSTLAAIQVNVQTAGATSALWNRPLRNQRALFAASRFDISSLKFQILGARFVIISVLFVVALAGVGGVQAVPDGRRMMRLRGIAARRVLTLAGTAALSLMAISACGGGGGPGNAVSDPGTPAGTYTITVTGTSSNGASQSIALTLVVD